MESTLSNDEVLYNVNGGVPKLSLEPIKFMFKDEGNLCVMSIEWTYEVKPLCSDNYIPYFKYSFEQFEPC